MKEAKKAKKQERFYKRTQIIKNYFINIYNDNGMRKTTEEVYNEFKEIVFAQIMYEEAYDKLNKYNKKN